MKTEHNETVHGVKCRLLKWADEEIHQLGRDVLRRQAQQFAADFENAWHFERMHLENKMQQIVKQMQMAKGDTQMCEECDGDPNCPWCGEPDGCNNRELREYVLEHQREQK